MAVPYSISWIQFPTVSQNPNQPINPAIVVQCLEQNGTPYVPSDITTQLTFTLVITEQNSTNGLGAFNGPAGPTSNVTASSTYGPGADGTATFNGLSLNQTGTYNFAVFVSGIGSRGTYWPPQNFQPSQPVQVVAAGLPYHRTFPSAEISLVAAEKALISAQHHLELLRLALKTGSSSHQHHRYEEQHTILNGKDGHS